MTPKDSKNGPGVVLSVDQWDDTWGDALDNARYPSQPNEASGRIRAHDEALRSQLAAAEERAEKAEDERDDLRAKLDQSPPSTTGGGERAHAPRCQECAHLLDAHRADAYGWQLCPEPTRDELIAALRECVERRLPHSGVCVTSDTCTCDGFSKKMRALLARCGSGSGEVGGA